MNKVDREATGIITFISCSGQLVDRDRLSDIYKTNITTMLTWIKKQLYKVYNLYLAAKLAWSMGSKAKQVTQSIEEFKTITTRLIAQNNYLIQVTNAYQQELSNTLNLVPKITHKQITDIIQTLPDIEKGQEVQKASYVMKLSATREYQLEFETMLIKNGVTMRKQWILITPLTLV